MSEPTQSQSVIPSQNTQALNFAAHGSLNSSSFELSRNNTASRITEMAQKERGNVNQNPQSAAPGIVNQAPASAADEAQKNTRDDSAIDYVACVTIAQTKFLLLLWTRFREHVEMLPVVPFSPTLAADKVERMTRYSVTLWRFFQFCPGNCPLRITRIATTEEKAQFARDLTFGAIYDKRFAKCETECHSGISADKIGGGSIR
eukprot:IDg10136t1